MFNFERLSNIIFIYLNYPLFYFFFPFFGCCPPFCFFLGATTALLIHLSSSLKKALIILCLTASALSTPPYFLDTVLTLLGAFFHWHLFNLFIPLSWTPVSPQTIGFLTFAIFWKVNLPPGVLILFNLFDLV